ncbi:hypothetical protein BFP70_07805 [Thioclava sp. SK-1]|nr:hypothetical protein BFP70_07805 [Thioclava sp. SK-1]
MDVILHVGAHRTATTSLQHWLSGHCPSDVTFWGPSYLRAGHHWAGLIRRADLLRVQDMVVGARSARRFARMIAVERARGTRSVIISEENVLGGLQHLWDAGRFYPDARARLQRLGDALGQHITVVALSIRDLHDWWCSLLGLEQLRSGITHNAQHLSQIAADPRGWQSLICDIQAAFAPRPLVVWRHENLAGAPNAQLAAMLGQTAPKVAMAPGTAPWFNAGQYGRYRPFSAAQAAQLIAHDHHDLAWLRSGPPGIQFVDTNVRQPDLCVAEGALAGRIEP